MKVVVLVSGGLDSFVTLALAARKDHAIHPLAFYYGQRHQIELRYAMEHVEYARGLGATVADLHVVQLDGLFYTKLAGNVQSNEEWSSSDTNQVYLPNRNAVMAMIAASYAERLEANEVWMGLIKGTPSNKTGILAPDATRPFVDQVNRLLKISTRDVEVEIVSPLIDKTKEEVVKLGRKLGVPILHSWTCFDPVNSQESCGKCPACVDRSMALAAAGVRGR
jgi:7-cyano-7-deazaguanine synthase